MSERELRDVACILDTAALLGGNEYLIKQVLDKLGQVDFTPTEKSVIKWALKELNVTLEDFKNQKALTALFGAFHRERLPRIVASALLRCGRRDEDDVNVIAMPENSRFGVIVVDLKGLPQMHLSNEDKGFKLALVYARMPQEVDVASTRPKSMTPARKISASLAHEKMLLSLFNLFAIFPIADVKLNLIT